MAETSKIKVSGYAQRVFFNDGIEYRNFSDNLVGQQFINEGGAALFTLGNFVVTTNIDPKYNKVFKQGVFSKYYTLDEISDNNSEYLDIDNNLRAKLNLDITNPNRYVWYGNFGEYLRVSLEDIYNRWVASIYVDNKVGSISGDSVTNFSYNNITDKSSFTIPTKYFVNPFNIKYTVDSSITSDDSEEEPIRNLTINYASFVIDNGDDEFNIIGFTGSTTKTNGFVNVVVDGNPFSGITGTSDSLVYGIKPNETSREKFFTSLDTFQSNLLNRDITPIYTSIFDYDVVNDFGVTIFKRDTFTFPIMDDGYNLNFFDSNYTDYLEGLKTLTDLFDSVQTNLIVRKYTAEVINSFDTIPRCDGDDLVNNGQKATSLLNVYGREFDEVKKYIDGIKLSHVVTYDKKDNTPDSLVKELLYTLGFDQIDFLQKTELPSLLLPSEGEGEFSGTSKPLSKRELDIELNRRLILNMAWLWKSKGTRKAVEFLFRFIGAPEAIVTFDEYIYIADKPVDIEKVKRLLYLYTGSVDISDLPFDEEGYPLPPEDNINMYFQKGGGWYRETGGPNSYIDTNKGNNPHIGYYDGGQEYMSQFTSDCFIPNFSLLNSVFSAHTVLYENLFLNYNLGFVNGIPEDSEIFVDALSENNQILTDCFSVSGSVNTQCPGPCDNTTLLEELYVSARQEYEEWLLKIEEEPYLQYSPEWQIIKNNNEIAKKNYFTLANQINCENASCLEICIDQIEVVEVDSCEQYTLVNSEKVAPFIYFVDENGNKVMFDDFPACCVLNGGTFQTFTFSNGQEACYCATSAPCNGLIPSATLDNGIIVWEVAGNNTNTPTDGIQPVSPSANFEDGKIPPPKVILESSPECCAWYGYDFQVNSNGSVYCVDNVTVDGDTNTAVYTDSLQNDKEVYEKSRQVNGDESPVTEELFQVYNTRKSLYEEYNNQIKDPNNQVSNSGEPQSSEPRPGMNLNSSPSIYDVLNTQYPRLSEGVYLKYSVTDRSIKPSLDSQYEDSSLMKCDRWEPYTNPNNGEVNFIHTQVDGTQISMNPNSNQYKECCLSNGFDVKCYVRNEIGSLVEVDCLAKIDGKITKCVDTSIDLCENVDDIKLVFGSNQSNGFLLPQDFNGECSVDISMDVMIKYDAEGLLECSQVKDCGPNLDLYNNSLNSLQCPNWITFNDIDGAVELLGNNLQSIEVNNVINWGGINPQLAPLEGVVTSTEIPYYDEENLIIWQTDGLQDEPTTECCSALGGELLTIEEWGDFQNNVINNVNTTYNDIVNGDVSSNLTDFTNYITTYNNFNTSYENIVGKVLYCVDIPEVTNPVKCQDLYRLVTTDNVCALGVSTECGLYSRILEDYWLLINQVLITINEVKDCIDENQTPIIDPDTTIAVEKNKVNDDYQKSFNDYSEEISECEEAILNIQSEINSLINENSSIQNQISILTNELSTTTDQALREEIIGEILNYNTIISQNINSINQLNIELEEQRQLCDELLGNQNELTEENNEDNSEFNQSIKEEGGLTFINEQPCCDERGLSLLGDLLNNLYVERDYIKSLAVDCYYQSYLDRQESYQEYLESGANNTLSFIDDLELCMTLEVGNNLGNSQLNGNTLYTNLPQFTTDVWSFNPNSDYTGVIIDGDNESVVNDVLQSLYTQMLNTYGAETVTENTFSPYWQTINLTITPEQCNQLSMLYPGRPLYFGVMIKNIECGVCLLIDNIQVSLQTDEIKRMYSTEDCPSFNLSCAIDDKRSWVYNDTGLEERIFSDLEYRYTDYEVKHSDLIVNSKEVAFRIDPANAIECDVYKFWKETDCECTGSTNDCLISGTTTVNNKFKLTGDCAYCPSGYELEVDGVTCTKKKYRDASIGSDVLVTTATTSFSDFEGGRFYNDITNLDKPVTLSSGGQVIDGNGLVVNSSTISNTLWDNRLLDVGVWGDVVTNEWFGFAHCITLDTATTFTIGIAADDRVRVKINGDTIVSMNQNSIYNYRYWHMYPIELSAGDNIIEIEALNATLSGDTIFGAEIYSADTATLSTYSADTQLSGVTIFSTKDEVGNLFDVGDSIGIGCPSGYILDVCDTTKTRCVSIDKTSVLYDCDKVFCEPETIEITIDPKDFLERDISDIKVKHVIDEMVLTNLIDVKSRQTISGYPLLYAFYELYLNANGCGVDNTNKLTYENLFEFMDSIGDYWTDLIEQVVPATTIWEGCRDSGKIYRNHIFDQNKFTYKKYAINCFKETEDCEIENITSESIGEANVCAEFEEFIIVGDGADNSTNCRNELNIILQQINLAQLAEDDVLVDELTQQYNDKLAECETLEQAEQVIRKLNTKSECNTVFITQIYDSNEYEGNVIVVGDEEYQTKQLPPVTWESENQLITDCNG